MILEIRLSNFFSIKDEVVIDMKAASLKSKNVKELSDNVFSFDNEEVLKTIAIYGANASGKSNIIKAIRFCCAMILNSTNHNGNIKFNYRKFKFGNCENKPSNFFINFVVNDIEYEYSFSVMQDKIVTESLHYYPKGRIKKIFTRDERKGKTKKDKYNFGTDIKRPLDVAESTSDKTLYLSRASQMDRDIAKDLFMYFNNTFILGYLGHNERQIDDLFKAYKPHLLKALQIADSDIVNITVKKIKAQGKALNVSFTGTELKDARMEDTMREQLQIKTFHKADPSISFDLFTEESAGTKKLFIVMLSILDIIANNKVLLVDEIGDSLHTDIIEYIFNLFRASGKAQLICTTHNTRFLSLKKFRKDQFYFVNKKEDASTDLYSLYDYSDFRDTMDLEKAYLQGRFDAVPFVNDSIKNLKQLIDG
ncbi:AAA family ATPase [Saccharicrinis fermentans]|uniref:Putative ATPase n=1 Tax=Saccharicrinis fermentans DSM 9555 = JCM 21142 TaxID=869213 RepID=W7YBX4_9BACT|nr:ATP-binding protein [Saccharicrinis fermentans]GAF05947.1 putative ATPase [Saccharicrinis fermentans DSM 9555 = JCM 21142]